MLFEKITIIKTLSIPKLLYRAHFLPVPSDVIQKANKMFYAFIWKSKDPIKRNILILDISQGRLSMADVASKISALKASWVVKIMEVNEKWSVLGKHYFNIIPDFTILKFNFIQIDSFPVLKKSPQFIKMSL